MYILHVSELLLIRKPASPYLLVQLLCLVDVTGELRHPLEVQAEAFREEVLHADHITGEVVLRVRVSRGGHLREVDDRQVLVIIDQQVELVKVSVNQAVLC